MTNYPAWVKCPYCDDYLCSLHKMHAHECTCPVIDDWEVDPYSEGGKPIEEQETNMNQQVEDLFNHDDFEQLLGDADCNASSDWEQDFISDMTDKFEQYGTRMYVSDKQLEIINRIAGNS